MQLKVDYQILIVILCMFLFYLRLALLRGQKRRQEREAMLKAKKSGKKGARAKIIDDPRKLKYQVTSWALVGIASVLMLVGLASRQTPAFPDLMNQYWYIITSVGVLLFIFCFK